MNEKYEKTQHSTAHNHKFLCALKKKKSVSKRQLGRWPLDPKFISQVPTLPSSSLPISFSSDLCQRAPASQNLFLLCFPWEVPQAGLIDRIYPSLLSTFFKEGHCGKKVIETVKPTGEVLTLHWPRASQAQVVPASIV